MSLRFITGVRWYKGLLETLNNMTFIYDPKWNASNTTKATLPVCFFHVKSIHETMSSEVSQKQMLFYNSTTKATPSDPTADSGLLNVVADNIVVKPKVYKLDVVIPYHNITLLEQSFVYNTHTAQCIAEYLINNKSSVGRTLGSFSTLSQPYLKLIKSLVTSAFLENQYSNPEEFVRNITHHTEYNKDSLEIMWRMRHILKMKMWNSWRYKYVAIIDIDITKEGTEDGVYEATLTLQEMPIVSMYGEGIKTGVPFVRKNPLIDFRGETMIKTLDMAGGTFGAGE